MVKISSNQAENRHFMDICQPPQPMYTSDLGCLLRPVGHPKNMYSTPEHAQSKISTFDEKVSGAIFGCSEKSIYRAVKVAVRDIPTSVKN